MTQAESGSGGGMRLGSPGPGASIGMHVYGRGQPHSIGTGGVSMGGMSDASQGGGYNHLSRMEGGATYVTYGSSGAPEGPPPGGYPAMA